MRIGVPLKILGLISAAAVLIERVMQVSADSSECTIRYSPALSAAVYYPKGFGLAGDQHLGPEGYVTKQAHRDVLASACFDPYPCYTEDRTQVKVATHLPTTEEGVTMPFLAVATGPGKFNERMCDFILSTVAIDS